MYGVGVLYSRLGKTAVNSVQEGTKLVCRKTLTRHLINRQEGTFSNQFSLGYNNGWRHKLDSYAYQWFTSTLLYTYSTPTRVNSDPLWLFMLLCFKFVFNFNDTRVNSTRTLPLNIFTRAWKTEKPCKLQYNSLTVFWLVSLWCNWVQMSCSLSVAYW